MATVADVLRAVERLAPPYLKEDWDNVGLNCGRLAAPVTRVLVALDPFMPACQEAVACGAEVLVTHHALLWKPGFVTDADTQGQNALYLIEHGVAHINAHTNLDYAPGGVNDVLAQTLALSEIGPLAPDADGRALLRMGIVAEQPLSAFLAQVKARLGCPGLRFVSGGKPVRRVAVGGRSCGGALFAAADAGCDTFVTADVKYNQFIDAKAVGLNLIDAGHFYTEVPVCGTLAAAIRAALPEVRASIAKSQGDCMEFFV